MFALCVVIAVGAIVMAIRATRRRSYQSLVEGIDAIAFEYQAKRDEVRYLAPQVAQLLGTTSPETQREWLRDKIHPDDRKRVRTAVRAYADGSTTGRIEYRLLRDDGGVVHVRTLLGERLPNGVVQGITIDATKQTRIEAERREASRLESVGRLAAGVAHEINTPAQFTLDSLQFVREAIAQIDLGMKNHPEAFAKLAADPEVDLAYLRTNVPLALDRATEGLARISLIVRSLRDLALPAPSKSPASTVELAEVLGVTIAAARDQYEPICEVTTDLAEQPRVVGARSELRGVIGNLLSNAARSISETKRRGTIAITTRREGESVAINVIDTGAGIPEPIRHLVFEPFFTTHEPGTSSGQGLAISRAVIARYGGTLEFESETGRGSTFTIKLPIASADSKAKAA